MKKIILALITFFVCGSAFSQYLPASPTSYGSNNNRGQFNIAILMPTGCGAPAALTSTSASNYKMMAKFYDSCNAREYTWNPKLLSWSYTSANSSNADSLGHYAADAYIRYGGTGITTGSVSYSVQAGTMIDKIIFYDPSTIALGIGTTLNGYEITPSFYVSAGTYSSIIIERYFVSATTIYFKGVTLNTIIKIYKQ